MDPPETRYAKSEDVLFCDWVRPTAVLDNAAVSESGFEKVPVNRVTVGTDTFRATQRVFDSCHSSSPPTSYCIRAVAALLALQLSGASYLGTVASSAAPRSIRRMSLYRALLILTAPSPSL